MFNFKKNNIAPWMTLLWQRLECLRLEKYKKVVYIYGNPDASTFRYRVYNMCQALRHGNVWRGTHFFVDELENLDKYLDAIDVVVLVRVCWSKELDEFIDKVKKHGVPLVFDTDDLVFDVEKIPLIMNTLGVDFNIQENYAYWFSYVSRIWLTGKKCAYYIGTNDFLRSKIESVFEKKCFVVNNFLNQEQIDISNKLFLSKKNRNIKESFKVGYFSGTPSHKNDFRIVSGELAKLLEKHSDVVVEIVGFMEIPDNLKQFSKSKRVIHSPLVDFLTLQKKISEASVNIVPLIENEFTNCKSELKFFEAAIVGTVTCATPTHVFEENICNGKTGYLCRNSEWSAVIEDIRGDKNNQTLLDDARIFCLKKYSPQNQTEALEEILEKISSSD